MKIGILKKGDKVVNVTSDFVAVERSNGEVDIIPILKEANIFRLDVNGIVTIGFGNNTVQSRVDDLTITTF